MIRKQITLKPETPDSEYTRICNIFDKDKRLVSCGSPDNKWMIVDFEDELDYMAFLVATGMVVMREVNNKHEEI